MLGYKEMIRKYKINSLVETDNMIERQRMIKDREEISNIQKACEITDKCFSYVQTYIKPGIMIILKTWTCLKILLKAGAMKLLLPSRGKMLSV